MKMTKIESAGIIVEQEGSCVNVECKKCFTTREKCGCKKLITISWTERKLALAKAYTKRHESKSNKKDHILDTTKKVEEPKPIKTVGIDNSDVTLALTPQHEPTVKENLSVPQPVKFEDEVPEYVYIVYASVIRCYVVIGGFKKVIDKNLDGSIRETFTIYAVPMTEERGEWLDAKGCYRTPEEALQVAKKLWGSK